MRKRRSAGRRFAVCEQASSSRSPQILATLAYAYARAGERKRADAIRQQVLSRPPVPVAVPVRLYAGLGDHEALFEALDRAAAERSDIIITSLKVDPLFDPVRPDPRFAALLSRVRLS